MAWLAEPSLRELLRPASLCRTSLARSTSFAGAVAVDVDLVGCCGRATGRGGDRVEDRGGRRNASDAGVGEEWGEHARAGKPPSAGSERD